MGGEMEKTTSSWQAAIDNGGRRGALTSKVIDGNSWKGQSAARSGFGVRFADYHNAGR